jgi:hypothetical protein
MTPFVMNECVSVYSLWVGVVNFICSFLIGAKPTQAEHAMSVDVKAIGKLGDSSFVLTAESTTLT